MTIHADHWQRALALVDTATTLQPHERDAWLADISAAEPHVAPLLRKLLSAHRRVETNDVLATLPRLPRESADRTTGHMGARIGPFALIELLGHGGMGSVWRARYADGHLKRDVAVKLPASASNPEALAAMAERFTRERDFLAQLEHPNIARLYDSGASDSGQPYLAMEYVAGEPIDRYCDSHRLSINARLLLYLQVLDAVEYAHRRLVLHRDLKPANVLVDVTGRVRLLDFGIAKLLPENSIAESTAPLTTGGSELTEVAGAAITLAYAAPEQINNGTLSTATDVYALGVMLYRLLTGSAPYQPRRDTRGALEDAVLSVVPANASTRFATLATLEQRRTNEAAQRGALVGDIDTILAKALKKIADERYPTVAAFADDIRRNLARQPISARPDSLAYRSSRFIARNRIAVSASALGVITLIAITSVAVWQAQIANASAAHATKQSARANTAQKFLAGMFASADPEQNKSGSSTSLETLERGLAAAERDLASDPEAHALVLTQIADIYRRMGLFDPLLTVQKRRVAVLEAMPNPEINALIDAQLELGRALGDTQHKVDNEQALARLQSAYATAVKRGAGNEQIVWGLSLIADHYRNERDFIPARDFAEQALALAERTLPNPSRILAAAYETNAVVASDQRRTDDARKFFAQAIAIDATGKGRGAVDQCLTLNFLAQLEFVDGDYEAALQQSLHVIEIIKNNFGDIKSNLAETIRTAAFSALRAGDLTTAKKLVAEPMDAEIASNDPMRIALAHYLRGRIATSISDFALAHKEFDLADPTLSRNPIWADRLTIFRSELALREGNTQLAVAKGEALRQSQTARLGARHTNLINTYMWLAAAEARAGQLDAARGHINQSCELLGTMRTAHPLRVRCDAYRILMAAEKSGVAKATELQALETLLTQQKNKQLPLIASLRSARDLVASFASGEIPPAKFPILE